MVGPMMARSVHQDWKDMHSPSGSPAGPALVDDYQGHFSGASRSSNTYTHIQRERKSLRKGGERTQTKFTGWLAEEVMEEGVSWKLFLLVLVARVFPQMGGVIFCKGPDCKHFRCCSLYCQCCKHSPWLLYVKTAINSTERSSAAVGQQTSTHKTRG